MTGAAPKLAGVVGKPIGHSLSPLIHAIWMHREQIDGYYVPVELPDHDDDFKAGIQSLKTIGFRGLNITIPHKERALALADKKTPMAERIGAANMLTFDGETTADNSDVYGFAAALTSALEGKSAPGKALVLGAGGAARGVVVALRDLVEPELAATIEIQVTNRTISKAEDVAALVDGNVIAWADRAVRLSEIDVLVNTTSLGMKGGPPLEIDLSSLRKNTVVVDIVYSPLETPLLRDARLHGATVCDGLAMLMHQAAPGYKRWLGRTAEVDDALYNALTAELKRRSS